MHTATTTPMATNMNCGSSAKAMPISMPTMPPTRVATMRCTPLMMEAPASSLLTWTMAQMIQSPWGAWRPMTMAVAAREATTMRIEACARPGVGASSVLRSAPSPGPARRVTSAAPATLSAPERPGPPGPESRGS